MTTTGSDGKRYRMLVLPRPSIPMFAATLDASRVAPQRREKLVAYQNEAADVLAARFLAQPAQVGPASARAEVAAFASLLEASALERGRLIDFITAERVESRRLEAFVRDKLEELTSGERSNRPTQKDPNGDEFYHDDVGPPALEPAARVRSDLRRMGYAPEYVRRAVQHLGARVESALVDDLVRDAMEILHAWQVKPILRR